MMKLSTETPSRLYGQRDITMWILQAETEEEEEEEEEGAKAET